ncbi:MAG: hypothetical protein WCT28_01010 [Patescibacteria group bacterium]|jgi:hypothetical protein
MVENPLVSPELQAIEREHARGIRMIEARPFFRRLGFAFLIVTEALMGIFLVVVVVGYLISGSFDDVRMAGATFGSNLANFQAIASESDAKQLALGSAKVLQGTPTSFDFYTTVKNPNTDWYATFTYTFTAKGIDPIVQKGSVMPGDTTYLFALGIDAEERPSSVSVAVEDILWTRVDRHVAPDVQAWLAKHNDFTISTPEYTPDIHLGGTKIGRTSFIVTNSTPYSYWAAQFIVVLERAGAVVGISRATMTELEAGEVRDAEVRWYGNEPTSATVTVVPTINYFDSSSYMPPRGTREEDIRDSLRS